jgi:hypothetical protein
MTTTTTWTNAGCTTGIFVLVAIAGDLNNLAFVDGDPRAGVQPPILRPDTTEIGITGTAMEDLVVLQFFTVVDGQCYGSELVPCTFEPPPPPGNTFIRGICNGLGGTPQITSAVFTFNFLFLGGPAPPCAIACDANGEGGTNITDGVFVLNFLFLGGPAPFNWVDSSGDGVPDPTCESAPVEACAASNPACPPPP